MNEDTNPDPTKDPQILPDNNGLAEEPSAPAEQAIISTSNQRSRKTFFAVVVGAILVILAGVGVFGYTVWYQNPDKVVHDAVLNLIKTKSMSSTGTITYRDEGITLDINFNGGYGESTGELSVAATMTIDTDGMKQDFEAAGVGRFIDDTLYVKLSGIEAVVNDVTAESGGQIPDYAPSIYEKIDDRWISIKASDYRDIDESIAKQQECVTDLIEKIQTDTQLSNEVMDLYKKNQIIVIEDELGSKNVNDTDSLGYRVSLDKSAVKSFTEGLDDTNFGVELKACDDGINFNEIAEDITSSDSENENLPRVELWISRNGHEFTEIIIKEGTEEDSESVNITLQPTFNKAINVDTPNDATSFEAVLEEIQQVILEYYNEAYSQAGGTMPEGANDDPDAELLPAV